MKKTKMLLLAIVMFVLTPFTVGARPGDINCPTGHEIQHTFSSGAGWAMCWDESSTEGIVLLDIYYTSPSGTTRKVLSEASLAQIQTEYDDGQSSYSHYPGSGLGNNNMMELSTDSCRSGQLLQSGNRQVICQSVLSRGYMYNYDNSQRQGELLELYSVSKIGPRVYSVRWRFLDNGTIQPAVGLSGLLPRTISDTRYGWLVTENNDIAVSFTDHYFWRLDLDIGVNAANDIVEQIKSIPSNNRTRKYKQVTSLGIETSATLYPEEKHVWRVRDANTSNGSVGKISYELVLMNYAHQDAGNHGDTWLTDDVFFTKYNSCERLAVNNDASDGCGATLTDFLNNENINSADVVAWYRHSYHHLPRDEDEGRVNTRWNSFDLTPRDWVRQNQF